VKHPAFAIAAALALTALAVAASIPAQTPPAPEVFLHRAGTDNDHPWTEYYSSNRFIVWYSSDPAQEASITQTAARTALDTLEALFDAYIYKIGFQHPYHNYADNRKYKIGVYVLRNGSKYSEGWAFGGTTGDPLGPGMWLDARAVSDKWALAHEFMHGLQIMCSGALNSEYGSWFYESHANLMPHQVYTSEVHYCAEMYTRMPEIYLGSTRNRYCNWQFFEYLIDTKGVMSVNDLWSKANAGATPDPFSKYMRINGVGQKDFNDLFGDFASRMVTYDMARGDRFRSAWNGGSVAEYLKYPRLAYLEALDGAGAVDGRYVSPFALSPQRYAYNIVRLYPDDSRVVTVRFRGDVQEKNNIPNWKKNTAFPLEADEVLDPNSDWRYRLVAVTGSAASTGSVSARYSGLMRASDGNPDVTMRLQNGETELYLVVAATPTVHQKIKWDQFYYTIYRYPYMVEITGAKPEGFQAPSNPAGSRHANGGGFVASTAQAAATAYVGPNARVLERAQVSGSARVEGRAVVRGSALVRDKAVVRDHALVAGSAAIYGSAVVADGAKVWGGNIRDSARIDGAANLRLSTGGTNGVYGKARVGGGAWAVDNNAMNLSGTAQILGDAEAVVTSAVTKGVFFGLVDNGTVANAQHGANRTEPPAEITRPRTMKWYGDDATSAVKAPVAVRGQQWFRFDSRGVLRYDLGGARSASLKIFDSRGRVLKSMTLSGTQSVVSTNINAAAQMLFWKVEINGRGVGYGKFY
jgi:hypothetical protein